MVEKSKVNNAVGRKLEYEAKSFVEKAKSAFALLNEEEQTMDGLYWYNTKYLRILHLLKPKN